MRWDGRAALLLAGDWLALGLFVYLGRLEHELAGTGAFRGWLATTAALALPWTVVAALMGALRYRGRSRRAFLERSLNAWLVAAPLALLLRAWLGGQATIVVIFFAIVLGLGGAFVLGWRIAFIRLLAGARGPDGAAAVAAGQQARE